MTRQSCTPSAEAYQAGGDTLIYAVADWIAPVTEQGERTGVVAEEPEWQEGTEYGYVDFEHGIIPLVHGYEGITHERPVRYGPWVPVKQEGADDA